MIARGSHPWKPLKVVFDPERVGESVFSSTLSGLNGYALETRGDYPWLSY
jgi:hypothetical protein